MPRRRGRGAYRSSASGPRRKTLRTHSFAVMRDVRATTGHRARPPRGGPRQPGFSLAGGTLRCSARPPRRPLPRARGRREDHLVSRAKLDAAVGGVEHDLAAHAVQHLFGSRAHASRRYRRGRCPTRAGSGPRHASGLRSGLRLPAVPSCRSTAASAPIAEPHHSRECSVPLRQLGGGSRGLCRPRRRRIIEVVRHGE